MGFKVTNGERLSRPDRKALSADVLEAVSHSTASKESVEITFPTEAEASSTVARIRKHVNDRDLGLRASKPYTTDDGRYAIEFRVTEKRIFQKKST